MEAAARVENEFHKFILGLGKSGQLSMAQITKGSQYTFDLYFFCYCSWGSRSALSSLGNETAFRNARTPNSRGCLSLNLNNWTPTTHQKGENGRG